MLQRSLRDLFAPPVARRNRRASVSGD
jgi:hypothetical protein